MAPEKQDKRTPEDRQVQAALKAAGPIPGHVAIIMDGNGRWARRRGRDRVYGHRHGVQSVRDVTEACAEIGIRYLTLYTFSTENWQRPLFEVNALMELLVKTIRKETRTLQDNEIRLSAVGDLDKLPPECRRSLLESIDLTRDNGRMTLTLALSYSGRWEILEAARQIALDSRDGRLDPEAELDEAVFSRYLAAGDLPDPDLLIRTGGEFRISNFMLWEMAYTELFITETAWPEFRRKHLYGAVRDYQHRDRRFGRVGNAPVPVQ